MPTVATETEFLEAWRKFGSPTLVARNLGISQRAVLARRRAIEGRSGVKLEANNDLRLLGTSTLLDADGNIKLQWIKSDSKLSPEQVAFAVREALTDVPPVPTIPTPKPARKDLLAVYPIGDMHVGMYAWAEEAGDNYDLKHAESLLAAAFAHLIGLAPDTDEALIIDVGDFEHYDGIFSETTRSHNNLDADGRYHLMIRVALRMMCAGIDAALAKHKRVTVICSGGNHNDMGAAWKVEALSLIYRKNPRVTIISTAGKFHYYEFGKVLLGVTHGDTGKPEKLAGVMAADNPEGWGRTRHRHWLTGHVHHRSFTELQGVTWETFRTLAPKDAWAAAGGYRAGRDMTCIVYHRDHGEVARNRFDAGMLNG